MPDAALVDIRNQHRRRYPERLKVIDGVKRLTWQSSTTGFSVSGSISKTMCTRRRPDVVDSTEGRFSVPRTHADMCTQER